jgi:ubiquitin C-terminal hydrolase
MKITVFPNLGNTCYLNSVLQCFIYNKDFQEILKEYDSPFVNCLNHIINKIDLNSNNEYNACLCNIKEIIDLFPFRRFEQQDAHECIIAFLELLIKECPYKSSPSTLTDSWEKLNTSPCVPIYHGQTKTYIRCLKCKTMKNIFEEFNSINLNIPIESSNLIDLFIKYLEKEVHDDSENLYYCETCNSNEIYEKKISLNKLPKVLIIVLKRYTFTGNKIISEVTFGNVLKIRESESNDIKEYKLKSIINHTGNLYNGHYTNYNIINDKCLFIDDEYVKIQDYNCKDAYILFYENHSS